MQKTLELKNTRKKTLEKISKQENRMNELRESLDEKQKKIQGFEKTIDGIKNSSDYKTYQNILERRNYRIILILQTHTLMRIITFHL